MCMVSGRVSTARDGRGNPLATYECPPELGRSGDGASSSRRVLAYTPARGRAVAPCRASDDQHITLTKQRN